MNRKHHDHDHVPTEPTAARSTAAPGRHSRAHRVYGAVQRKAAANTASTASTATGDRTDRTDRYLDAALRGTDVLADDSIDQRGDVLETRATVSAGEPAAVQRRATAAAERDPAAVHDHAAAGVAGAGTALPHASTIAASFGKHDISNITAHVGGPAASAADLIGAEAYALGTHAAFRTEPDLHTAAHEAAHVVQQRAGVQLAGGVGQAGDIYEQHADRVADAVVSGNQAESILDEMAGGASAMSGTAVQRNDKDAANPLDSDKHKDGLEEFDPSTIGALENRACKSGDGQGCIVDAETRGLLFDELGSRLESAYRTFLDVILEEKINQRLEPSPFIWQLVVDMLYVLGAGAAGQIVKRMVSLTRTLGMAWRQVPMVVDGKVAAGFESVTETVAKYGGFQVGAVDTVLRGATRGARALGKNAAQNVDDNGGKIAFLNQLGDTLGIQQQTIRNYVVARLNDVELITVVAAYDKQDHSSARYRADLETLLTNYEQDVEALSDSTFGAASLVAARVNGPHADRGPEGSRVAICQKTYGSLSFKRWARKGMEEMAEAKTTRANEDAVLEVSSDEILFFESDEAEAEYRRWVDAPPQWTRATTGSDGQTAQQEDIEWPDTE